ncbi:MAG TPA: dihydrofolate reductase family protein [Myxococcales bacterium]|nr:dihydrofolate reductase family protein [Myxococcales bacterium]
MSVRFAVFAGVSLDGCLAREDDSLDWLKPFETEEHGYGGFFASVDALAIGRRTYDVVRGFPEWPYAGKRVVVCTRRPIDPMHGEEAWPGAPRDLAEKLAREGVRRVYLDGGELISSFLREGLVDELTVSVVPVILGGGRRLFCGAMPSAALKLVEATPYPSGLVKLRYLRA